MGKDVMVIFDFDRTIIDGDSDNWVVTQMGLTPLFQQLQPTMPWNSLMNKMMEELHLQGKCIEDVEQCLMKIPLDPEIVLAITEAWAAGCDLKIVSDANQLFIETVLKHHGVLDYFSEIITNPTLVDEEEGTVKISPYHDFGLAPHGCSLCPSNMCKGLILDRLRASMEQQQQQGRERKRVIIYIGDGKGDYCPSLRLLAGDYVMPRDKYPLWERIQSNPEVVKANVNEWNSGAELRCNLLHLISGIAASKDGLAEPWLF